MKIAITGHTKGIGKYLAHHLQATGFSRTNGYDITEPDKLVGSLLNYDVFINNTYHPTAQEDLFKRVFSLWKNTDKLIINMMNLGSLTTPNLKYSKNTYFSSKFKFLETTCEYYHSNKNRKIRISNLFLGTLEQNPNYEGKVKVSNDSVLESINFLINSPKNVEHFFLSVGIPAEYPTLSVI